MTADPDTLSLEALADNIVRKMRIANINKGLEEAQRNKTEATILKMIPIYIEQLFGGKAAAAYNTFVVEEDFNELELIVDDLKDNEWNTDDCSTITALSEACEWNDALKKKFWVEMRDFLEIELKTGGSGIGPKDMKWSKLSDQHVLKARKFLAEQCYDAFQPGMDGGLMHVFAYGMVNDNTNLVPLLYDVYHRYRVEQRMAKRDSNNNFAGESLKMTDFFKSRSTYFHNLQSSKTSPNKVIQECLRSFGARLLPIFFVTRTAMVLYDNVGEFIDCCNMVGQILNELAVGDMRPLQIDVVIVPKGRGKPSQSVMDTFGDDSDDEDDEKDEDDDEQAVFSLTQLLAQSSTPIDVMKETISCSDLPAAKAKIASAISATLNGKGSRRVAVVIDRRGDGDDELLVYMPPAEFSTIPENGTIENMIYSSANYLFPKEKQKKWDGGKADAVKIEDTAIPLFVLGVECLRDGRNRLQFFCNGQGIRVVPEMFGTLVAHCFENQQLAEMKKRSFAADFALNCVDPQFEQWYAALTS